MLRYLKRSSKRIELRLLESRDFSIWKKFYETMNPSQNIWDVSANEKGPFDKKSFQRYLKNRKEFRDRDQSFTLGVFEKKSGDLIGFVMVMDIVRGITHTAFLGYCLHNKYWGKGYGKESVALMIDIAFKDIKLHRIEAGIEPYNRRSIMLARSLGLRKEGLKKRIILKRGEWRNLVMYSATSEDFGIKWKPSIKK